MFKTTRSYQRAMQAVFALCLTMFAGASLAAQFLYTGGHELDDARVAALGHSYVEFTPNDAGWATALSGGYGPFSAILVGEDSGDFPLTLATSQAIAAYVSQGGRIIVASDHNGNVVFLNAVFGYSSVVFAGCYEDDQVVATRQAVVTGTSFANGPSIVGGASCTSAFTTASLPTGAKKFYQGNDGGTATTLVFGSGYGNGALVWLGFDYCCGDDESQMDGWYMVLDSSLKFSGGSCSAYTGVKLTMCTLACTAIPNSPQQRASISMFTTLTGTSPSCSTLPARAPEAVGGGGGGG